MVQARVLKKLLSTILDLHQWNFRMLITIVNRVENIFLNLHGLCTLYKGNFSFPIYLNRTQRFDNLNKNSEQNTTKSTISFIIKNHTVFIGSSGRPVAQSITVWTPTNVAGIVSGLLRSACSKTDLGINMNIIFF